MRVNKFNRFDVSVVMANKMAKMLISELSQYNLEIESELNKVFSKPDARVLFSYDASISSTVQRLLNNLSKRWTKKFNVFSDEWASTLEEKTTNQVDRQLDLFFDEPYGIKIPMSQRTKNIMKAMAYKASSLIVTVKERFEDDVKQSVFRLMTQQGLNFSEFQNSFKDMLIDNFKKHRNKALNVALDQTRKVYQTTAILKLSDAGVNEFIWRHAGGSKEPRPYHKNVLNGKKFRFDDPPVIDTKTGERGLPAQAINCKCYIEPVI